MNSDRPLSVTLGALGGDPRDAMLRLSKLGAVGIGGVQLSAAQPGLRPRDLDTMARRGLRERLTQLELRCTGIDLWIPPAHLTDPQHSDRAADAIRDAIGLAAELGRGGVSLALPAPVAQIPAEERDAGRLNASGRLDGPAFAASESLAVFVASGEDSREDDSRADQAEASAKRERLQSFIDAMLDDADRHGVDLIDHAVPPNGDGTLSGAGNLHRLRVGIDPSAWLARGREPAMALAKHAARLSAVRLSDLTISGLRAPIADELVPSAYADRQLDPTTFAGALSIVGSEIVLIADARQWPDPWDGVTQTAEVWRRAAFGGTSRRP